MKQKRYTDKQGNQARLVLPAGSHLLEARQEPSSQHAIAQRHNNGAAGALDRSATAASAAAMVRALQSLPSYFSHALSRWSAMWDGSFYDLIAVIERFRSLPSLAVLDISISRQLNLETGGTRRGLEGR